MIPLMRCQLASQNSQQRVNVVIVVVVIVVIDVCVVFVFNIIVIEIFTVVPSLKFSNIYGVPNPFGLITIHSSKILSLVGADAME